MFKYIFLITIFCSVICSQVKITGGRLFGGKIIASSSRYDTTIIALPSSSRTSYFPVVEQTTHGTNYYYASSDNGGNDANSGLTPELPKATLPFNNSTFMNALQPGDSVLLKRGSEWASYNDFVGNVVGTTSGRIVFGAYGTKGTEIKNGVYDNDPYIHASRMNMSGAHWNLQNIIFDDFTIRASVWSAGSSSPYPPYDNGIEVSTVAYFARLNITAYFNYDVKILRCTFNENLAVQNRTHPSHIPLDNLSSGLKNLGNISQLEIGYCYFPDTQTWGEDRMALGLVGDSLWIHHNTVFGALDNILDLGSGNFHVIECNYFVRSLQSVVKIHSQGGWADSIIFRFNICVTEGASYALAFENCSNVNIYNNTLVGKFWGLAFWDRDRFRLEAYYGTTKHCKIFNNLIKGAIYIGGQWRNEMIIATDKFKWDTVYTFSSYTSTTSDIAYISVTDFGKFTGYLGIGMASGDTLHKYNHFFSNTYDQDYNVRYAQTGDFPNQNGATNNDYSLTDNTHWLRSHSGETTRSSIAFSNDQSEDLTVPTTFANSGDYSLTAGSADINSGTDLVNPSWTSYIPLLDYNGNNIKISTVSRGALQAAGTEPDTDSGLGGYDTLIVDKLAPNTPHSVVATAFLADSVVITYKQGDTFDSVQVKRDGVRISSYVGNYKSKYVDTSIEGDNIYTYQIVGFRGGVSKASVTDTAWVKSQTVEPEVFITDYINPSSTGEDYNQWSDATDAYSVNSQGAYPNANNEQQDYHNYSFGISSGTPIGIEVKLVLNSWTNGTTSTIGVELSNDGGSTYSSTGYSASNSTTSWNEYTLGGSTNLWGLSWTSGSFSISNFRLRVKGVAGDDNPTLDAAQVRVYYTQP